MATRYRLNALGQGRRWLEETTDRDRVVAVGYWLTEHLCDPDSETPSRPVNVPEGDAEATDIPELNLVVVWRLDPLRGRIDVLRIEPLPDEKLTSE